jgi:amino acid transporter, AAT family
LQLFAKVGNTAAAGIINFVVITTAMSGCNSGIYRAGLMLYTLGVNGQAPKYFAKVSSQGVPLVGTIGVLIGLGVGVFLSYIALEKLFVYVYVQVFLQGWFLGLSS